MSRLFAQSDWVTPMIVAVSLGVLISLFNPAFLPGIFEER